MSEKSRLPRNHGSRWVLQEIEFVEKCYGNVPTREIAATLGRSVSGVRRIVNLPGLGKAHAGSWIQSENTLESMIPAYRSGYTPFESYIKEELSFIY